MVGWTCGCRTHEDKGPTVYHFLKWLQQPLLSHVLFCNVTMHSSHWSLKSISTFLEPRIPSWLDCPVEYGGSEPVQFRARVLKGLTTFASVSSEFTFHIKWTQARQLRQNNYMMDDHKKRDKTPGKEPRYPDNIHHKGARYVSEAILDPSAPDKPPGQRQMKQRQAIPNELCLNS